MGLPDVASDDAVVSNSDASEDRRVAINRDIVLQNRMTRNVERITVGIELETLAAKGDTLVKTYMIADNASLAYHHTRTMVDAEILTDLCSRMDVDTRTAMRQLGDDTRDDRHSQHQ